MKISFTKAILLGICLFFLSCITEEEDEGPWACYYEERTTSCSGSGFGPWENGCVTIDYELREGITPEGHCMTSYSGSDQHCPGSCCLSFQFRNTRLEKGRCRE